MLVDDLAKKLDDQSFNDSDRTKVKLLLEAINDWPHTVDSVDDFVNQLQVDLQSNDITYKLARNKNTQLDMKEDAWKMESYAVIISLMKLCDQKPLNEIIAYLL